MHRVETVDLAPAALGTARRLTVHRFGEPGAAPRVYVQAALHADETPAMLVAHHLLRLLLEADRRGEIRGEIVVVPAANPIGLAQRMLALHVGRGELGGGGNFNRGFPNLTEAALDAVRGRLGTDPAANDALVREALAAAAAAVAPHTEVGHLRAALLRLSAGAHIVLDLHCHFEGIAYLYLNEDAGPGGAELSAEMGSLATLVGAGGGAFTFDEAHDEPWRRIRAAFPEAVTHGCLAATIEYRGQADVSDEVAEADAAALLRFLRRRGAVAGEPGPLPEALCGVTPVDAVDHVRATVPGVLVHRVALGERVRAGQVVAEIVDPERPEAPRTELRARADGIVYGRLFSRVARPGTVYLSIAGTDPDAVRDGLGDAYP